MRTYDMIGDAQDIVSLLSSRRETIAIAESLTGGALSAALTDIPGTSHIYLGSIIAYSVDIKIRELAVKRETLEQFGVVSEAVAFQMADGIRSKFSSTWSIATTGVAGPGPSHGIPAGSVWIAIVGPGHRQAHFLALEGERDDVRRGAVASALSALARILRG